MNKEKMDALHERREQVVQDFHDLYYMGKVNNVPISALDWMGITTLKCPMDLWTYQEMIFDIGPEVIIECGVYCGGSASYLYAIGRLSGPLTVVGIDITLANVHPAAAKQALMSKGSLSFIEGSSTDEALVAQLYERFKDKRVMVILDSDHHYEHVKREMELYAPFVKTGGYMVVEDTNVDRLADEYDLGHFNNNGPARAVREFLEQNSASWQADLSRERQMLTFHPGGFLKRVAD